MAAPPPRPGQFTLTSWLDPALEYFAKQAEIPTADYAAMAGGLGIGAGTSLLLDLFTKGLLNKGLNFAIGATVTSLGIWGKLTPTRLRKELIPWGLFNLLQVLDMKPSDALELRESVDKLVEGLKLGDTGKVAEALLRTPEELRQMLGALGAPVAPPLEEGVPPTPPAPPLARPTAGATVEAPSPPAPPAPPAAPVVAPPLYRATSDTYQPPAPPVAKRLFRETLG
jgi:hypothetical protein